MTRPAVLRQIESHVTRNRVTPFRLRATDAQRLTDYVRGLEGRVKVRPAPAALEAATDAAIRADDYCPIGPCALGAGHEGPCDDLAGDVTALEPAA